MIDVASLIVFAGALAVVTLSPGPNVTALVARVIARGHRDVWPFLAAMWLGETLWLSVAVFGLAALAGSFGAVMTAVKFLGVAYLLYLAWEMWTTRSVDTEESLPSGRAPTKMFFTGLAITLGNPKIVVFYMSLLPTIVDLSVVTFAGWGQLVLLTGITLAVCDLLWVVAATQARRWLRKPRFVTWVNRTCAACMAGAAASIAVRS